MTDTKPTPYAWTVTGTAQMFFGDYAQHDAEQEAKHIGGTARAFPLFAGEPAQSQLNLACKSTQKRLATQWGHVHPLSMPSRQPLTVEQIKDFYGDSSNFDLVWPYVIEFARAIESAHGIGGES